MQFPSASLTKIGSQMQAACRIALRELSPSVHSYKRCLVQYYDVLPQMIEITTKASNIARKDVMVPMHEK